MKIGIYSPYLDTLGGGERYILTFAEFCLQHNWKVELFWPNFDDVKKAQDRFQLWLDGLKLNPSMYARFSQSPSYAQKLQKWLSLPTYDLIFWLSDGSIPYLRAKQNWLHFQVPFQLNGKDDWSQKKLTHVHRIICNSQFTKTYIDQSFGVESEVIYPPVAVHDFEAKTEKENIILSVGRFDQIMNAKRQDVLIEVFKQMVDQGLNGWKLVLAGGMQHNEEELLKLREQALNYPIEFAVNASYEDLIALYQKADIYWHATGFEVEQTAEPSKVEHFGISIVEAMAAGCIVIAHNSGGIPEIITDKKNGYLWHEKKQLLQLTQNLISNPAKKISLIKKARKDALKFSKEAFFEEFKKRLY
ncbi:glycosyltransferase family 4 protein [Candidatus Beckwithbacteria bacterium]|nr:glycosyltransferase family 4 protein [Candidatus Beckwithbacteria bacterium]